MKIEERKFKGVFEITLDPHSDERGFFMRTFDQKLFEDAGISREWVQENQSRSERRNIIRGLHFQFPPYSETKLVRVVSGKILDVFVDLRKDSPTFGQWDSIVLSTDNKKMVLIPRGVAHGYRTLSEISEVLYKIDNYYSPEHECGLLWNDQDLNIDWGLSNKDKPILSDKDMINIPFEEFTKKYENINLAKNE